MISREGMEHGAWSMEHEGSISNRTLPTMMDNVKSGFQPDTFNSTGENRQIRFPILPAWQADTFRHLGK
ncbi:MAG: hypothetical protein AMS27_01205 [Bacteroides sp. SM23_62_1]|nr:MAG: hypothetical protein AMS27_01205 [Bacteroides sp. SM23_62_1]